VTTASYRSLVLIAAALVFAAQKPLEVRADLLSIATRTLLGYVVSVAFLWLLYEYAGRPKAASTAPATSTAGRRLGWLLGRSGSSRLMERLLILCATASLVLGLGSEWTYGYILTYAAPVPRALAAALMAAWLVGAVWLLARPRPTGAWMVMLLAAAASTRALACLLTPAPTGDMLPVIDVALDAMLNGEPPYRIYPPALPYLPGTFLSYLPAGLLGIDLRWSNAVVDLITIVVLMFPARHRPPTLSTLALPVAMLMPSWVIYGVDTTMPPSVLMATLVGLALVKAGPRTQSLLLGFAVATNQTFVVLAVCVGAYWIRRYGLTRAARLALLSLVPFLVLVVPFILWDPTRFFDATIGLQPFPPELFVGRMTLRPLVAAISPAAPALVTLLGVAAAVWYAHRHGSGATTMAAAGLASAVLFLLLHRTFTHYYLPAMAMVLTFAPLADEPVSPLRRT
jgi:hypothetical protein